MDAHWAFDAGDPEWRAGLRAAELRTHCRIDMFCGVFMGSGHDGIEFEPDLLQALARRDMKRSLDIQDAEDADDGPSAVA